jgi:hypothetical protein
MKSGEAALNELEITILTRMADHLPTLFPVIPELVVTHREFTGVGSFTYLASHHAAVFYMNKGPLSLDSHILMPGVKNGMGALLFFKLNSIAFLEIFTYGDDTWTGNLAGYSLVDSDANKAP